jgi:hypothetical protein
VMLRLVTANGSRDDNNNLILRGENKYLVEVVKTIDIKYRLFVALMKKNVVASMNEAELRLIFL